MDKDLHLPWDNNALRVLLLKVMQTGEATKVDFKRQLNIGTGEYDAELMKDILAMANSHDWAYQNHGFIILGVADNKPVHTDFGQTEDALQARVDLLIRGYIDPFIPTHVRIFSDNGITWGVIVIPPTRNAPHIFSKGTCKLVPGDIFVRKGTTTAKPQPGDYSRFFRVHLDEQAYEFRQQIEELRREIVKIRRERSLPRQTKGKIVASKSKSVEQKNSAEQVTQETSAPTVVSDNLPALIEAAFAKQEDPIAKGLLLEAQKIRKFLDGDSIPWGLNNLDKELGMRILDQIEEAATTFWESLGILVLKDQKAQHDETILKVFAYLAQQEQAPSGVSYTDWGVNVRYLPLVVALYIVFIGCVANKKYELLKKICDIELRGRSRYDQSRPIPFVLFYIRRAAQVFQTRHADYPRAKWCDAVGECVEQIVQRKFKVDELLWDAREAFVRGEFVLCLSPLEIVTLETKGPAIGHPSSGTFLFHSDAEPILQKFLRAEVANLSKMFKRPLKEVLSSFDQTAGNLVNGTGCWGDGFTKGAEDAAFPKVST